MAAGDFEGLRILDAWNKNSIGADFFLVLCCVQ